MSNDCEFPDQGRIMRGDAENIIMTLLKQRAVYESRRTYQNIFTPRYWTQDTYKGKYFVRGMRGIFQKLSVYAKNEGTTDGTISFAVIPFPLSETAPLTATITVSAGSEGWFNVQFVDAWNYDMCFVYVTAIDADISYGYDKDQTEPDAWTSPDSGTTWLGEAQGHYHFRLEVFGQTVGDVPVSGFVNIKEVEKFLKVVLTDGDGNIIGIGVPLFATTVIGSAETHFNNLANGVEIEKTYAAGDPHTGGWIAGRDLYPYSVAVILRSNLLNSIRPPCNLEYEGLYMTITTSDGQRIFTATFGQDRNIVWNLLTVDGVQYWTGNYKQGQEEMGYRKIASDVTFTVALKNNTGITIDVVEIYILGASYPIA